MLLGKGMKKVLLCCLLVSVCDVRSMNRKIPSVVNFMDKKKEVGMYNPLLGCNIYLNFVESKTTSAEVAVDWALTYFPGLSREELFGWPVFYKKEVQISKTPLDNGGFILSRITEQEYRIMFTFNQENLPIEVIVINLQTDEIAEKWTKSKIYTPAGRLKSTLPDLKPYLERGC